MKKISKFDSQMSQYQFGGESDRKGICIKVRHIRRESDDNFFVLASDQIFNNAYACITDDGSIEVNTEKAFATQRQMKNASSNDMLQSRKMRNFLIMAGIVFLVAMLFLPLLNIGEYFSSMCLTAAWICMGLACMAPVLYLDIRVLKGDDEVKQFFRFHAAEHAVINAYYDLNKVPTIDEIKNYSNYSYMCGTVRAFMQAWLCIGVGLCRLMPSTTGFILLSILFFVLSCLAAKKKFFFCQVLCTANPTDIEYEVAIKALEKAIEQNKKIERKNAQWVIETFEKIEGIACFIRIINPDVLEDE